MGLLPHGGWLHLLACPTGDTMCEDERLYLLEYVEKESKRHGIPYEVLSDALDKVYRRVGIELLDFLDKISSALSNYVDGNLEKHIFTSLPKEAFQEY